ncbi:MAG TPA: acyl-ACP--UDP-N-acetylglucosamine O-acyltransferase [Geminicoccaceae bacterium]|jgi:UDP-N-acetylglucosamine acyltransferase|nr:acyl-ACP--UDP-N-acetylglucosamine O-acyltransferase [Geminicoccaceae bacterium]
MAEIHPTAIVDPRAELSESVVVGPYCVVGAGVRLGAAVRLESHVVLAGRTTIGSGCRIFPFACLGHRPQDLKYRGEDTGLVIGRNNQIREHVTMHPGTAGGGGVTRVGDDGLFMAGIHVAHDCQVGDGVIMANNATLGGHVEVQDHAYLGGLCAVHQFVRIGRQAMIGGLAGVEQDVIPYGMVLGNRAYLNGMNIVGMKRRGVSRDEIQDLRTAYRLLFAPEGAFVERLAEVAAQFADHSRVMEIVGFIRSAGNRAVCMPRQNHRVG